MANTNSYQRQLKYAINRADYTSLRRYLTAANAAEDGTAAGCVHTLCFTSYLSRSLPAREQPPQAEDRYSLHYYNNDPTYLLLEQRNGSALTSAMVTEAECRALLAGETDWLLSRHNPVLRDFHTSLTERMLLPQMLLTYQRQVYTLDGLELSVALDTDIRTTLQHMDFLDPEQLAQDMADQEGRMLLEISYSSAIPDQILCLLEKAAPHRKLLSDTYGLPA